MGHILQVIGSGAPGGGTVAVLELASGLREAGYRITVATDAGSYLIEHARQRGLRTLPLNFSHRRSSLKLGRSLLQYIKETDVTLAHAHGARAGLPLSLTQLPRHVPRVYTVHGFHYRNKPPGIRQLARSIERLCMAQAAATVFVSFSDERLATSERLVSDHAPQRVIYNGVNLPSCLTDHEPPKLFDIAFLGRLHPQKNPLLLADVLRVMRPMRPRLAVIGDGELGPLLRERLAATGVSDQVTFCGEQAHLEGLRLLGQARVLLLPSLFEGLPLAIIEAMHLGIPVVASAVGGLPELVSHGVTGFLADSGDADGFASALHALLQSDHLRDRIAAQARQRARQLFTADQNLQAHIGLYRQVLRAHAASGHGMAA